MSRPPRGAVAAAAGAVLLGLALALPWVSLPGGALQRGLMTQRGVPIPATGAAWSSLPLTSVLLVALVLAGLMVAYLTSTRRRRSEVLAGAVALVACLALVVVTIELFADRVASEYTAAGAGGYLGTTGILLIALGSLIALLDTRAGRQPAPHRSPGPLLHADAVAAVDPVGASRGSHAWMLAGAVGLLGAYLATRLSFADRFPVFLDEAIYADYAEAAAQSRSKLFIALEIGQGPVLTWLSVVWVKLGFAPLTAVRLVSVAAGLVTVVVVGLLGRLLWGAAVGWVAAALCLVLPFFVVHDGIGIYEPLVTLIMASALLLQIAFARRPDLRLAVLLGLVLAAGMLTKQNTLPALVLLPASLLCFDWWGSDRRRRLTTWLGGVGIAAVMVLAAELVQRSSGYNAQREAARENILLWPARKVSDVLDDPFGVFDLNWATYRPALVGYVTIPLLLMALAGAALGLRSRPRPTALLLLWVLVPFAIGMLFQLRPFPRHAMFLVPPALVLCSYAFVQATRLANARLPKRLRSVAVAAAAVLLLAPALVLDARVLGEPATARYPGIDYWQYVVGWPAGGPFEDAGDLIGPRARGRETVVLTPGSYGVLRHALRDDGRFVIADPNSPHAAEARFALFDTAKFPVDPKGFEAEMQRRRFVPIGRFSRPRGACSGPRETECGGTVVVFERP